MSLSRRWRYASARQRNVDAQAQAEQHVVAEDRHDDG
jgi:hypothetical protein